MKIEQGKFYKFHNGMKYRCYATDAGGNYPNHGAYLEDNRWMIIRHDSIGLHCIGGISNYDIISEWVEPHPAESWPVDAKVMVSNDAVTWYPKHFAKYENGFFYCWSGGTTSFSADGNISGWKYAKLSKEPK